MVIVVKVGGRVIKNNLDKLVKSIVSYQGKLILVHGGGDQVTEYSKRMSIEPKFIMSPEGVVSRYTSREELDVYVMVMSLINKMITSMLIGFGKKVIGVTGVDGPLFTAVRKKKVIIIDERGRKRAIDGGYTGKINDVNFSLLNALLSLVDVVVISPVAIDVSERVPLNVDGDQVAKVIAISGKVEKLIFLTDVDGVIFNNKIVKHFSANEAIEMASKISPGMNRKLLMGSEAVNAGVRKVVISSGLVDDPINNALNDGGTVIE
ncbi:MAG: [LysW]-aminoadipate/[LysW]-glutamate kinase [Thermoprotei archaeon]